MKNENENKLFIWVTRIGMEWVGMRKRNENYNKLFT